MNKAHCDYYTNFVNVNSVNQRRLFNASKSLLNISRSARLPLSANDHQLANNFGASFTKKRKCHYFSDTNGTVTNSTFSEFNLLSESEVYGLITLLSKTTKPNPTKLVFECLDVLLPPITRVITFLLILDTFLVLGSILWYGHS